MARFKLSNGLKIDDYKLVKVKLMNHIVEVMAIDKKTNGLQKVKKLSKTDYVMLDSGEIKQYNLSENRAQNIAGLKDTFKKIRDLINNNFTGGQNELHLTLTYAENMTDTKKLYEDFKNFWKRYKYKFGNNIEYLTVVEPQGRGAWHCHVLIRHNDGQKVFIPSKELEELWGNGFIKVKTLNGIDNIGAYLSAYLGDIEISNEIADCFQKTDEAYKIKRVEIEGQKKSILKGGRLHLYPPGMNLYRHSKGIVFPEVEEMEYQDIKKIVGNATPNYSSTVTILDNEDDNKVLNCITYENYNIARKKTK